MPLYLNPSKLLSVLHNRGLPFPFYQSSTIYSISKDIKHCWKTLIVATIKFPWLTKL